MLTIAATAVAFIYIISVLQFAVFANVAYWPNILKSMKNRNVLILIEITSSIVADLPLHFIAFQVLLTYLTKIAGSFEFEIISLVFYTIQIPVFVLELILFIDNAKEYKVVKEAAEGCIREPSINNDITSIFSSSGIKKLILPGWTPKDIITHSDIPYGTDQELRDIIDTQGGESQAIKLKLNVLVSANKSGGLKPVIIHIHGGSWKQGSKDKAFYPYEKLLITQDHWVIVNISYRLAPDTAYTMILIDIKRAIRWVKQNIEDFGGDPSFIFLAGDSSGGQLASIAALTINQSEFQPGFEQVDTSVKGVINLNSVLDIESDQNRREYFSSFVAQKPEIDDVFMAKHSPMKQINPSNSQGVAWLVITGGKDAIVDVEQGKQFKHLCNTQDIDCTLLVLPGGHHALYVFWSPRAYYSAQLIRIWCRQLCI